MNAGYTMNELLIITAAREIHDRENVILGVGLPMISGAVAKALHAPHATLMTESGIVDFEPLVPLNNIADAHSCRGFSYATDLFSTFTMTYRGFVDVCFLGVAQVDRFGNVNTTVIGDYYKPKMRLPGSGGAPEFIAYAKRTVLTLREGEIVEKLDYLTSPGFLSGGDTRESSGLFPVGTGPSLLITSQGCFRFDAQTREMYLVQLHPGVELSAVRKRVPWDLKVADDLAETAPPSAEEIGFIRRFSPRDSVGKSLMAELATRYMLENIARQTPDQTAKNAKP